MDDRRAHFLTMLGDACLAAGVAGIALEVCLADGDRVEGVPSAQPAQGGSERVGETGFDDQLLLDDEAVTLAGVVEFAVKSP